MNLRKKTLKASFTIEASVIVPLTLVLIAAVMTLVFALHDRVIFSTVSIYEVMERAGNSADGSEPVVSAVSEMLEKRLITVKNVSVSAETEEDELSVITGGTVQAPLGIVRELLGEESGQIQETINISNLNARKILVKYKTICDGLSALQAGSEKESG